MARDYKHEYATYQGKPEQIKKRAERVMARREEIKHYGKAALAGKDVDHIDPLRNGGSNAPSNLRIASVKKNRGWRRGKHGY